jgi:hypothetical protein
MNFRNGQGRVLRADDGRLRTEDIRVTRWASIALKNLKKSAIVRGIRWDKSVDAAWIRAQYARQQGRCFYTGISFEVTAEKRGMRRPSIDRRDSGAGYTTANVVLCLVAVNYMKNDWPEGEFMALLEDVRTAV